MLEVFRSSAAAYSITDDASEIRANVAWMQLGVRNDKEAALTKAVGLKVVMDRGPKIGLFRPFWKPRLSQKL